MAYVFSRGTPRSTSAPIATNDIRQSIARHFGPRGTVPLMSKRMKIVQNARVYLKRKIYQSEFARQFVLSYRCYRIIKHTISTFPNHNSAKASAKSNAKMSELLHFSRTSRRFSRNHDLALEH